MPSGMTLLTAAAQQGAVEVAKFLVEEMHSDINGEYVPRGEWSPPWHTGAEKMTCCTHATPACCYCRRVHR